MAMHQVKIVGLADMTVHDIGSLIQSIDSAFYQVGFVSCGVLNVVP